MPNDKTEKPDPNRAKARPSTPGQAIVVALSKRFDVTEHRRYLARDLEGVILDLGAGTGAMVPYLRKAATVGPPLHLHAIEPDPDSRRQLKRTADKHNLNIHIGSGRAESLPYANDSFDVVIASAVFCTIQDPARALEEVHRVMKPDGEFRFLEHVRSGGLRGYVQDAVTPFWKRVDNGCHPNRRTDDRIAAASFTIDEMETLNLGVSPSKPFVRGTATKVGHTETESQIDRKESPSSSMLKSSNGDGSMESC